MHACVCLLRTYICLYLTKAVVKILLGRNYGGNVSPQTTMISINSNFSNKIHHQNMIHACVRVLCACNIFLILKEKLPENV